MKIVRLESTNVKRLRAVEITPEGHLVVVGGRNGQGKSSLLDSVEMALAGRDSVPDVPVRRGEATARVVCDLGDLVVTRTFSADGKTSLVVANHEGARFPSPQAVLDKLVGRLSFDPLAFSRMKPAEQRETLRNLVGLDFSVIDGKRAGLYEERTAVNRTTKGIEARLAAMAHHEDAPAEPVSVAALMVELQAAAQVEKAADHAEALAKNAAQEVGTWAERIGEMDAEAERLRQRLADLDLERTEAVVLREAAEAEQGVLAGRADAARAAVPDAAPIRERIASAEDVNRKVRENTARAEQAAELEVSKAEAARLTAAIDALDAEKAVALAGAKFPVEALSFDESGVLLNGLPFDQASSAEQLRVSVAMGVALNPRLRVLLVRDGSLLDDESLAMLSSYSAENDLQLWLERVGDGEECSVVIEDGAVRQEPAAAEVSA